MKKSRIVFLALSVALMLMLLAGALFGQATQKNNVYRYLSIFSEVFDLVKQNYVDQVSSDQLMDGAFSGVTDAIDEFSYYVPPQQMAAYKNYQDGDEGNGVGLVITKRFGYAYVVAPVEGSPADKAGIERGDFIEKIDGQPTQKMAIWQMRTALRNGRPVKLQVLRGGQTKREEFTIAPTSFHPSLESSTISGVAYIKMPYFEKGTASQFHKALDDVRKRGTRKLIVDVRGNAGGDVDEAILAADDLLTSGLITSLEGRRVDAKKWQADRATMYDGDVEVLTDPSTAAGGEIFAAAIHGNGRGKTVGTTTYGKALVQKFIQLPSGGGVYMTVGHYTTPDLKPIKETGVKPDVTVDLASQSLRDQDGKKTEPREDLILNKALTLYGAQPAPAKKAA